MEKIIVYLDDAAYAQQQLAPMSSRQAVGGNAEAATHWVLVACAPRMTRRVGKWLSHTARENWRTQWAEKLFSVIKPALATGPDQVTTLLAKGPLPDLTRKLLTEHGACRVLDARRPKFGQELQPVTADQQTGKEGRWEVPGAVVSMGAVLVLAAE